ncbi:hypothetical protein E2C01_011275 [Portunus trituberculatus]|uniref:Secreted protein n=1 Tax=Portunus trituberculatus TaxID=210409 RepID=A0A5B7DB94_PORTR|nr:hypothetical protein [Portunus trituberculatus]
MVTCCDLMVMFYAFLPPALTQKVTYLAAQPYFIPRLTACFVNPECLAVVFLGGKTTPTKLPQECVSFIGSPRFSSKCFLPLVLYRCRRICRRVSLCYLRPASFVTSAGECRLHFFVTALSVARIVLNKGESRVYLDAALVATRCPSFSGGEAGLI